MIISSRLRLLVSSAATLSLFSSIGTLGAVANANAAPRDLSVSAAAPLASAPSFADLIQRVAPAVVSIDVTRPGGRQDVGLPQDQQPPFQFMFPSPNEGQGSSEGPMRGIMPHGPDDREAPKQRITGSGFFISPDGYIVTNNHVVEGATSITVRMADQRQIKARLIGRDPDTDLAVIKVDGQFSYVNFEDKAKPRVGDWVIAVGNPYDLGGTATAGIVSALARENVSGSSFVDYMQIDAPINKGNSGGPTFDTAGRVVGVNSAIFSPSGGSVGIGFAIPADVAEAVSQQLIAHGKVARGYIGATIQNVGPEVAESLGVAPSSGALVAEVVDDGPSARAGLQAGDVITAVDGRPVSSAASLTQRVSFDQAGSLIHLQVLRNGHSIGLNVQSGLRPSEAQLAGDIDSSDQEGVDGQSGKPEILGMRLSQPSKQKAGKSGVGEKPSGVVVEDVVSNTNAEEKGVQAGDVIVKAGSRFVRIPSDVSAAVAEAKKEGRAEVLLLVSRNGRSSFIPLSVDQTAG